MRLFAPAAFAAVMIAVLPTLSFADEIDDNDVGGIPVVTPTDSTDTTLDLGIDVSDVPHNAAAVKSFIGSLEPETQAAIMGACETYMQDPGSASSPNTYAFCASAVRG